MIQARRLFWWIMALFVWHSGAAAQTTPQREITQIQGSLYRFRNAAHFGEISQPGKLPKLPAAEHRRDGAASVNGTEFKVGLVRKKT